MSSTAVADPLLQRKAEAQPLRPDQPPLRAAIAIITTRFPKLDETFVIREITELERHGQPVLIVPLLRDTSGAIHEEARPWMRRALYTGLLTPRIVFSNVRTLVSEPRRYLRLLLRLLAGTIVDMPTLIRTVALFPKSVHLARVLTKRGIGHVHAHFATHATTMAYVISELSNITFSFTVHGPDVFVNRLLLREKIAKARFIRAVSLFNKAFLCGLYPVLTEGKIEVVHTGVNPDVYADAVAAQPKSPDATPQVLSVAALSSRRGFPHLVDACARLLSSGMKLDCRIVGTGPLLNETRHWIARHGLDEHVHLLGAVPQHEVAKLMAEADVFVLPSVISMDGEMDGVPTSLMEAMAAGKPVVAAAISGIPELVRHNVNGLLVDASHADRIAEAVRTLVENPAIRERFGRAGQQHVRLAFDVRKNAEKLIALFDRYRVTSIGASAADRLRALSWSRLNICAIGIRRVHEQADSFVAEATISDGVHQRDVIVRQQRAETVDGTPANERARHDFEVLSTLRQSLPGPRDGILYTVPQLVMFDEPNDAVILSRADGTSLAGLIASARTPARLKRLETGLRKAGAWLRVLQESTTTPGDGRHILTAVVLLAQRDLALAAAAHGTFRRHRQSILDAMAELESRIAERPLTVAGQHGSFQPANVYVGEDRVEVTDFGSYREGLPLEDVAEMLLHLDLAFDSMRGRRHLPSLRLAFIEGYGGGAPDADALRLFAMTKALRLAARGGAGEGRPHAERIDAADLAGIVLRSMR